MNTFVLIPNPKKDVNYEVSACVASKLSSLGATVYVSDKILFPSDNVVYYDAFPKDAQCVIVIGGDGSILDASVLSCEQDLPILGINLGKMGYLSELEPQNLDYLSRLLSDDYQVRLCMLLAVDIIGSDGVVTVPRMALNDVCISHKSGMGMSVFSLSNATGDTISYRADGILVSTPAGSTAYSLSAGGPIVAPGVHSMLVTPLSPHSFFNRSILFDENDELFIKNLGEEKMEISIDGRPVSALSCGQLCRVYKSVKMLKMITFSNNSMFKTLFTKMRLLEDIQ